ncbi:MAG: tetratricopeptide repeat protein [Treponema sp.]|uniref:tetratricopeptide repeat protein n=1 Tax=Treponema sp. TaxID=166 RepID=UPI003FA310E3
MSTADHRPFYSKSALKCSYDSCKPSFVRVLDALQRELKKKVSCVSVPAFKYRIKGFKSYYKKLLKQQPAQGPAFPLVTDILGIRIICPFLEDIQIVEKQICDNFQIYEIERKGAGRAFSEFGYESVHILIYIPRDIHNEIISPDIQHLFEEPLLCEIQIRTILQDAWAEVEHELVYKAEFSPFSEPLKRKLAAVNAMLGLGDVIFQEIRDYQNKLNCELARRRETFYEQADILSAGKLDAGSEIDNNSLLLKSMGTTSPYEEGTVDDMLLEALHAHNSGNLDAAITIYTRILRLTDPSHSVVLSVIYKHRGMAYFAKNEYEKAKADFLLSVEKDSNNYMSLYYVGIIYSVLNDEENALIYFDRSLEKNAYNYHAYYRKALALFRLNRFKEAIEDLNTACDLGLKDNEAERLRELLNIKLDIHTDTTT